MNIYLAAILLSLAPLGASLIYYALRGLILRRNAAWRASRATFRLAPQSLTMEF